MAYGINGSWGTRTEFDPNRQVSRLAMPQSLASRLHYEKGKSAEEIRSMAPEDWKTIDPSGIADQESVADVMRAYEHYTL